MDKIDKPNKCFGCGYEVPQKAEYCEELLEVPCARINQDEVDVFGEVSILYACPCGGTVRTTFHGGYKDKEEMHKSKKSSITTSKLDFGGLCGKHI